MRPSTFISISFAMSRGSLTVHGSTLSPSAWDSSTSCGVALRQNGDHVVHCAAFTSRGNEAPWAARASRACQGEGLSDLRWTVSKLSVSIVGPRDENKDPDGVNDHSGRY